MNFKKHISKIVSGLLIAIYLLSIMPRLVLHNVAANHKDIFVIQKDDGKETVSQTNFHCHLQDQVCTEPSLPALQNYKVFIPLFFADKTVAEQKNCSSTSIFSEPLRGPPIFA